MIDAHHHFWKFEEAEFSWITPEMASLRRDFGPTDLQRELVAAGVTGAVSVQSRTSLQETEFLLKAAGANDFIVGVVGWVDLKSPDAEDALDRFKQDARFKGVREICQGAPDEQFFTSNIFNEGVRQLTSRRLAYDLLIYAHQLPAATAFVDRHPNQQFILDHCAKPEISGPQPAAEWRRELTELARRPHVACKLSGLATEVRDPAGNLDLALLRQYFEAALDAFGPDRLMLGSDWPVLNCRTSYGAWFDLLREWLANYSDEVRDAVGAGTATRLYSL
ncbi:amidohydrolase family protein [Lacipirellula parvula]|uniref:Amidohydrolase family protein n=1 Tax=Lacipirellula parvula TaxID=2650471 RepID=A0A5K7XGI3_9BACT|nr:amidohydrolase family protein [Lacipirellula parvula]BBO33353.1 amidohydrolase family protein [Lacipirellula parvula]